LMLLRSISPHAISAKIMNIGGLTENSGTALDTVKFTQLDLMFGVLLMYENAE
jgi:hypothetical protein